MNCDFPASRQVRPAAVIASRHRTTALHHNELRETPLARRAQHRRSHPAADVQRHLHASHGIWIVETLSAEFDRLDHPVLNGVAVQDHRVSRRNETVVAGQNSRKVSGSHSLRSWSTLIDVTDHQRYWRDVVIENDSAARGSAVKDHYLHPFGLFR